MKIIRKDEKQRNERKSFTYKRKIYILLVANHELIANGWGLFLIKIEFDAQYKELLIYYYVTYNKEPLEIFLLNNCWLHNNNGLPLCKEN